MVIRVVGRRVERCSALDRRARRASSSRRRSAGSPPDSIARRPEAAGRLLHALQDADDESYARCCCEALAVYDVRDHLDHIVPPVLALWGESDAVAPREKSDEIAAGVPHGEAARVVGAAHLPPAEQPDTVAALLLAFSRTATGAPDDRL